MLVIKMVQLFGTVGSTMEVMVGLKWLHPTPSVPANTGSCMSPPKPVSLLVLENFLSFRLINIPYYHNQKIFQMIVHRLLVIGNFIP